MTNKPSDVDKMLETLRDLSWDPQRRNAKIETEIKQFPRTPIQQTKRHRRKLAMVAIVFCLLLGSTAVATGGWELIRNTIFFRGKLQSPDGQEVEVQLRPLGDNFYGSGDSENPERIFELIK